jgi:two-component system NarL family response regulator
LTEREVELLRLLAAGRSNKDIAQTLSLSENTVKYHIKNILQKLDVHNRTEAAAHAVRIGIVKANHNHSD